MFPNLLTGEELRFGGMVRGHFRRSCNSCLLFGMVTPIKQLLVSGEEEEEAFRSDMKYNPHPSVCVGSTVEVGLLSRYYQIMSHSASTAPAPSLLVVFIGGL